jgi:hypothetical protein
MLTAADCPLTYCKHNEETGEWEDIQGFDITDELINYNGQGEDSHETCYIQRVTKIEEWASNRELAFSFCKTARKPYDKYVVATYIMAQVLFGNDVSFSSDGEFEECAEGKELAEKYLDMKLKWVYEGVEPEEYPAGDYYKIVESTVEKS